MRQQYFQLAGMMNGHSIMQGGPSFPFLCPAVSSLLVFWDKEKALGELPSVGDISRYGATSGIISLIEEVSLATDVPHICTIYGKKIV